MIIRTQEKNIPPASAAAKPSMEELTAKSLEIKRQELHNSLESKKKLVSLLEGYIGNRQSVAEIKQRIEEALNYLKAVEERGEDHV